MNDELYDLIDAYVFSIDDPEIKQLYEVWDKGDCSSVGLIRILLISEIRYKIKITENYYHNEYREMLNSLLNEYFVM